MDVYATKSFEILSNKKRDPFCRKYIGTLDFKPI